VLFFSLVEKLLHKESLHTWWATLGSLFTTMAALFLYRVIVFTDFLPNTYWAKVDGDVLMHIQWGFQYVVEWMKPHAILVLLSIIAIAFCITFLRRSPIREWPIHFGCIVSIVLLFIAYTIRVGGDNPWAFPLWRHFVTISPLLGLVICYAIVRFQPHSRFIQLFVLIAVIFGVNVPLVWMTNQAWDLGSTIRTSLQTYPSLAPAPYNPYYEWLARITQPDTTIASSQAGELPFVVDAVHIDMLGLNNRHIAKFGTFDPDGPPDSKTDMIWLMDQHPDIIEGYLSAQRILNGMPFDVTVGWARHQMVYTMVTSPIFESEYCFLRNGPFGYLDRVLFLRITYWSGHPKKAELECVPISQTTLNTSQ
jgi:hypothetical protein